MEETLRKLATTEADPVRVLARLVECVRPRRSRNSKEARQAMQALCFVLEQHADLRAGLRNAIWRLLTERQQVSLYTEAGIFPSNDVMSETLRRLSRSCFLPDAVDLHYLRDVVYVLFYKASDHYWVEGVGVDAWVALLQAMRFDEPHTDRKDFSIAPLCEAMRVLSYRITSIGLEPEVLRLNKTLENRTSPFMAQNIELLGYVDQCEQWWSGDRATRPDGRHFRVLLAQCHAVAKHIRAHALREGTSLSLTLQLQRLRQNRLRLEALTQLLETMQYAPVEHDMPGESPTLKAAAELACELIGEECRRNDLFSYMRKNSKVLALRVTENAGHTGEHYITSNRRDYFTLLRAALGAGIVIAFMACIKIVIGKHDWTPLNEALGFCLNYGLGFVVIHMLGLTVATKQPAMTANAIAASVDGNSGSANDLEKLTTLIAQTIRSQTAAILGNVALAVPTAMLIGWAVKASTGATFVGREKAMHMLGDVSITSGSIIFYAAIAGVCLFLAGQVAGFYDNLCAYNQVPERILQLKWPRRVFGERAILGFAQYIRFNLGALTGNFTFGCMLGGVWALGVLFDVPLDIRHVAFSSANIGIASTALNFAVEPHLLWSAIAGTALIGLTNLVVSFTLALLVALRARGVTFPKRGELAKSLLHCALHHPREFLFPPRGTPKGKVLQAMGTSHGADPSHKPTGVPH